MRINSKSLLAAFCFCLTFSFSTQTLADAEYPSGLSNRSIAKMTGANRAKGSRLSSVCKSTKPISALFKNALPGHISPGDPRAPGFALVCNNRDCPKKFPTNAYYSDGTLAFKLGYYGTWSGNGRPRAYCGTNGVPICSASGVTRNSRTSGRDGKVYIDFGGKSCRSATPGQRNGSPF